MRWEGRRESSNIEDRRDDGGDDGGFSSGPGGGYSGGGFGGFPINLGGGGIGTIVVVLIIAWVLGINPLTLLSGQPIGPGPAQVHRQPSAQTPRVSSAEEQRNARFVSVILADTEDRWKTLLPQQAGELVQRAAGMRYQDPTLVMFRGTTRSGCGQAETASGPFYCPADQKVYIDLAFYDELKTRFKAPGDFAQAYVIAHEIGHHIQNMLGILPAFNKARQRMSERDANRASVRVELQADCFAGVWAKAAQNDRDFIDPGDIEQALNAASHIGDDAIQKSIRGYAVPDSFTHGTSEQRVRWFKRGFESGRLGACDSINAQQL
jgi:predicted metalloprotease